MLELILIHIFYICIAVIKYNQSALIFLTCNLYYLLYFEERLGHTQTAVGLQVIQMLNSLPEGGVRVNAFLNHIKIKQPLYTINISSPKNDSRQAGGQLKNLCRNTCSWTISVIRADRFSSINLNEFYCIILQFFTFVCF